MKSAFFDVDTQLDFLFPAGALYVPGAERIAPALSRLTAFAKDRSIPIISTLDTHSENDLEFKIWKPHCVAGTQGWQKYEPTQQGQILFEKNTIDFFPDRRMDSLLSELSADRYLVYGLVTEYCVRSAVFGLLQRGAQVDVVTDAVKSLNPAKEREMFTEFRAAGGRLIGLNDALDLSSK